MDSRRPSRAWTLIELLVVMAILTILAGLLLPTLSSTRERMQRNRCRNDMRQFIIAAHLYAVDQTDRLPSGSSEQVTRPDDEHIPMMARPTRDLFLNYAGALPVLSCPNWRIYFKDRLNWHFPGYGFVLGFDYLGGRFGTPWQTPGQTNGPAWISPQNLSDSGSLVLVTDPNNSSTGFARAFAPHTRRGFRYWGAPIDDRQLDFTPSNAPSAKALGAEGGNVGLLDGSISWKPIRQMQTYRGSGEWDGQGCWANW